MNESNKVAEATQLEIIIRESGLSPVKSQIMLERFQDFYQMVADWEVEAKTIVVTSGTQTEDIEAARKGRLFLRRKRIDIEDTRKELKAGAIAEGKAIQKIANILTDMITPIEKYLEQQEKFVEIEAAKEEEKKRLAWEAEKECQRVAEEKAKEKAAEEERQRIKEANELADKKAAERQKALEKELKKSRAEAAKREKALEIERENTRIENEKKEKILREERAKAQSARVAARLVEEKLAKEIAAQKAKIKADKELAAKNEAEAAAKIEAERKEKEELELKIKENEKTSISQLNLEGQIDELAKFIMAEIDGEPSQDEGAVECAIRLLRQAYCDSECFECGSKIEYRICPDCAKDKK